MELEYKRHQKNIYQKLVLGPAHRLQSDLKNLADEGKSSPGVRELNELLAIKVREAWTELNTTILEDIHLDDTSFTKLPKDSFEDGSSLLEEVLG